MSTSFSDNLIEKVLIPNLEQADSFKVLSGFVSANFLNEIVKLYPDVNFNIYIGMANQGITFSELTGFRQIAERNNVSVFLQQNEPSTHIKAYEWRFSDGTSRTMTGSANFSTNGFLKFHEILVDADFDIDQLIDESGSFIDVLDPDAIDLATNSPMPPENKDGETDSENVLLKFWLEQHVSATSQTEYVKLFRNLRRENRYNSAINVPVSSFLENSEGRQTLQAKAGRTKDMELFPEDVTFRVLADDGTQFLMKRTGLFGRQITPERFNLGRYLKKRLGISESDKITEEVLEYYGRTTIRFYATNDIQMFLLDFSQN
ncbi:NgoFVII family restriction endonuclease [Weissella confusa]|uniref:restriction endonuclease PLD domain-containing protein n=1 Tax=Weissella confusa TaxID=1583 RepID=UPI0018A2E042|nr:restriction endonuclease PLD domain-containing protein [Weissella confusa]MBF7056607.1 NgoFVII family restriction endonuclease [Weissella confusa]